MKKTIILICAMLVLISVNPVQAKPMEPTGTRIILYEAETAVFPADAPFYISHGWYHDPFYEPKLSVGGFDFKLELDGEYTEETYVDRTKIIDDIQISIYWVFNFPDGMSGTHSFVGHWFATCEWAQYNGYVTECQNPNTSIEVQSENVVVTFITP